jgi:hypothetical protein
MWSVCCCWMLCRGKPWQSMHRGSHVRTNTVATEKREGCRVALDFPSEQHVLNAWWG